MWYLCRTVGSTDYVKIIEKEEGFKSSPFRSITTASGSQAPLQKVGSISSSNSVPVFAGLPSQGRRFYSSGNQK
jgi:hypothetical protein